VSASTGDGEGTVHLAHVWIPLDHRDHTPGPWHWWNVYKDRVVAETQAARVVAGWRRYCGAARSEVHEIGPET
jgi:hypothetical protein